MKHEASVFKFGEYELDERVLELRHAGRVVDLQPKPLQLLLHLVRHADRVVSHQELQEQIWPGVTVTEASLKTALYSVRRALGDGGPDPRWIATVPRFGYRFRGKVERQEDVPAVPETAGAAPEREDPLGFVDREAELRTLRGALHRARQGERRVVLLHGPPGIGKTRTALEIAREAEHEGFEIHIGRVEEGGGAPAFWPWTQILRSLARARAPGGLHAVSTTTAPDWVRLAPELAHSFATVPERGTLDSEQSRFRLLDGVTQLLQDSAHAKPLLLVIDDLHWADDASLALLAFVARNLTRAPLLLIGTHRELDGSLDAARMQALSRIGRDIGVESVGLRGLERASVASILERTLGRVTDDLLERVERATGGNPFFVSEVARWLAEQGPAPFQRNARLPVPERLREAVLLRVAERSHMCQSLLRAASVIGTHFALPVLRRILDTSVDALLAALSEAERADLVRYETPSGHYAFAHGVVREALYERLTDTERMRLHAAIGETLEKLHAPDPSHLSSELAHHFAESAPVSDPERAIRYARAAAQSASESFAYEEAAAHYRRALRVLELLDRPTRELRCDLLIELGDALRMAGAPLERTQEICGEALRLARALDHPALLARVAELAARDAHGRGGTQAVLEAPASNPAAERHIATLEEVLPRLSEADWNLRTRALLALSTLHEDAGQRERAAATLAQALELAEAHADPALIARALGRQIRLCPSLDGVERQRLDLTQRIIELSRVARRPDSELLAQSTRAALAQIRGDRAGFEAAGAEMQRLGDELRIPTALSLMHNLRSLRAQLDGRLDEAEREALEMARLQMRFGATPRWVTTVLSMVMWWLALLRGQAAFILPPMEQEASRLSPVHIGHLMIARLYCEVGRIEEARAILLRHDAAAIGPLPRDDAWVFCAALAGEICAAVGDRERAAELYELLLPYASLGTPFGWVLICTGSVSRALGSLAALLGRWSECGELFERSLAYADGMRSPVLRAVAELQYARALRESPLRGQLLASARERAQELGMKGVVDGAQREADASR